MDGRLPKTVLNQNSALRPLIRTLRLTRARNQIVEDVKRIAQNSKVASILDIQRLKAILASWPDYQPAEYTPEESQLLAVPDALGAAYFIENVMGANYQVAL